jgi:hypothetical protein
MPLLVLRLGQGTTSQLYPLSDNRSMGTKPGLTVVGSYVMVFWNVVAVSQTAWCHIPANM